MQLRSLNELFVLQLKDLYSAENQIIKALPRMAKKAQSTALKEAFLKHLEETKEHVTRLDEIADNLEINPKGHVCQAMKGLLLEGQEIIEAKGNSDVLDAGLVAAAERVEHHEIAAYQVSHRIAVLIGKVNEADLLKKTLEEEKEASENLLKIAKTEINKNALGTVPGEVEEY